jgi:hypothetical protein
MEEILNILNDKYRKVEMGVVDVLLSIVLAFDLCDHRKSGRRVRRISEYQPYCHSGTCSFEICSLSVGPAMYEIVCFMLV